MKTTKALATIVVLSLLLGIFSAAFVFSPVAKADGSQTYYLTIVAPDSVVTTPTTGIYSYTTNTWVNCTAPLDWITGNTQYVFDHWAITPLTDDFSVAPGQIWVDVGQNKTATAVYDVEYLVTLTPNPVTAQGVTDWMWSAATGWVQENSMWVANNTQCEVGVEGLIPNSPDGVYVTPYVWAYLVNFTGAAASNFNTYSFPPEIWYSAHSL